MRIYEIESAPRSTTVYHGTARKNLVGIMKTGLVPRINRWENKFNAPGQKASGEKAVFVTPNFDDAKLFADQNRDGGAVVAFELLPTDVVDAEQFYSNELLVRNTVAPTRIRVVWPASANQEKLRNQAAASLDKTELIRQLNKITKESLWTIKSASKTTSRVLTFRVGNPYYDTSILLAEYPGFLEEKGVDPAVVNQVKSILNQS